MEFVQLEPIPHLESSKLLFNISLVVNSCLSFFLE